MYFPFFPPQGVLIKDIGYQLKRLVESRMKEESGSGWYFSMYRVQPNGMYVGLLSVPILRS